MSKKHMTHRAAAALLALGILAAPEAALPTLAEELHRNTTNRAFSAAIGEENATKQAPSATKAAASATYMEAAATWAPLSGQAGTVVTTKKRIPSTVDDYTTHSVSAQEEKMMNFINRDRSANGLYALRLDSELSRIARIKSKDMLDEGYFAHESPTWGYARDMLRTFGYDFRGAGENIARHATIEKAQAAFLSSPGHRKNIMSSVWDRVGIGIVEDRNGYVYVTQIFAR